MKKELPSHAELLSRGRIIKGLVEAHDESERRLAQATDRESWLRADAMRGALEHVGVDFAGGQSIAELKAEMVAVFGTPCPLDADQRRAFRPFTGADLGAMRDDAYRDVIALLDRLQGGRVSAYPKAVDPARVGTYSPLAGAGGGFVFDEVLEYRVWSKLNGESVFQVFETFEEADAFSKLKLPRAEPPLALVLQREYVEEPEPGRRFLVRQPRITEWQVAWLTEDNRRTPENLRRILGDRAA